MRRITILFAALGVLLLLPAAQAFANGTAHVSIKGSGAGEVNSTEGTLSSEAGGELYRGTPPLECTYASPGPATGVCENELEETEEEPGAEAVDMVAVPAPGSKFVGWNLEEGIDFGGSCGSGAIKEGRGECIVGQETGGGDVFVAPEFECTPEGEAEELCGGPSGPTNLRTLTITKSPSSSTGGGNGTVSSKPKGIKCGAACDEAVARMYKSTPVELTAKPAGETSTFVKWENAKEGGACDGSTSATCTVPMAEDESLQAVFGGTSKAFSPAEALTLSKGESSGKGTVKASGLACEADCSSTTVLYQGPVTEPKVKAGKTVILKQAPAFGSVFSGWTGCDSETEAGECVVAMETAREVVAEYTALPNKTLTVNKSYAKGNGSVSSKPKGIKCGTTCTSQSAAMPEGASVELVAKPASTEPPTTFVKWVNPGGDCDGSTSTTCVAGMDKDETIEAVFSTPGKAFSPAETLTLAKAGSGFGTVKASGLTCEVLCTSASSIYQGPVTEPKVKAGKTVILKAVSAPGSKAVAWSGCDSVTEAGECVVAMETSREVTATFDELE